MIKRAKVIKEKAEKVKETKEKEKDMEEEKVAEDQKEKEEVSEEVLEKEEERKVERMCGRLKEKATRAEKEKADKELFATIAVRPVTLLLSVGRHQVEKEKVEKEKCGMFRKLEKKTGALIHKQVHQRSHKQEQHQQQKEMNKFDDWLPRLCLSLKKLMMMIM